jgi:hypothetical protein
MNWGGPEFVLSIVALAIGAGIIKTWIKAKHGYPLEERGRKHERRMRRMREMQEIDGLDDARKVTLLTSENERLNGQVGRLEDRIAVLERIVTDPAERTAREIDALR